MGLIQAGAWLGIRQWALLHCSGGVGQNINIYITTNPWASAGNYCYQ